MKLHLHPIHEKTIHEYMFKCHELMIGNTKIIEDIYGWVDQPHIQKELTDILADRIYEVYVRGNEESFLKRKCFSSVVGVLTQFPTSVLEVDDVQAGYTMNYLEHIIRLERGQFHQLWDIFTIASHQYPDQDEIMNLEFDLKRYFFPELDIRSSYGVGNKELPLTNTVAWEIYETLREHLSWKRKPQGGFYCSHDEPSNWSGQPRMIIEDDPETMLYLQFARRFKSTIYTTCKQYSGDLLTLKLAEIKDLARREDAHIKEHHTAFPLEEYKKVFGDVLR